MPILNVLCFISLTLKYLVIRYLLFYRTVRVKGVNETLNTWVLRLLPIAVTVHLLFGVWMFTAPGVFLGEWFSQFRIPVQVNEVVDRFLLLPYLAALIVLIAFYVFFELFVSCLGFIRDCISPKPEGDQGVLLGKTYEQLTLDQSGLFSYNIHMNEEYNGPAGHMEEAIRKQMGMETIDH